MFGSVVIRKQQNRNPHRLKALERYDILHKKDFNPNAGELILFREGVEKDYVSTYLVSLCKCFYEDVNAAPLLPLEPLPAQVDTQMKKTVIHQCSHCKTVYVPALGDEEQGIAPGTSFETLPLTYCCPLCEGAKQAFVEVEEEMV
jgi:rubredoxin